MDTRPVRPFVLALALAACAPTTPQVRRASTDSGRSQDVAHAGATEASDATTAGCEARDMDADAVDAPVDAYLDERAPDFRLVLLDPPLVVTRGESAPLRVRIDRIGGFDAPVLIDVWGLPVTLWAQARESRVGDDVIELTVEASEDAEPLPETPYAVQASALGIRRVARTTISTR